MNDSFMQQAQELQRRMEKVQKELDSHEVTGYAAGGLIEMTMSGKLDPLSIRLSKDVLKDKVPDDVLEKLDLTELEDMLLVVFKDTKNRVEKHVQERMSSVTGGLNLPGL
ncbi:MAG: YbaB/EbfC family nucleoid-associated protein [Alphaproteobacteria bacterium]|nr:MAG: YbaB/EbfC family nucleoid-associated protein [Alphaproteobacteria bacterium]